MGKIVVITGGTSGIGLALKKLYEQNGDTVLTFSLDETGESNHYYGSVDHEIKVRQVFNDIYERFGKVDVLINNAGFGMSGITELVPTDDMRRLMDVNYFGTLYCIRAALPHMNSGSKIINLSSAMALFPVPFRTIYGSAKAAVLNMSFGLRMELAPLGIDVTAICPGDVKTNFTANRLKDFNTTERYGDRLETATLYSDSRQNKRMPVEFVADKIFKAVEKEKLKPFYIVGGKYKFLYFLTRITPKNLLLKCTAKKLGGKPTSKPVKKTETSKVIEEQVDHQETNNISVTTNSNSETTIASPEVNNVVQPAETSRVEESLHTPIEETTTIAEEKVEETTTSNEQSTTTENVVSDNKPQPSSLNSLLNKMSGLKKPEDPRN